MHGLHLFRRSVSDVETLSVCGSYRNARVASSGAREQCTSDTMNDPLVSRILWRVGAMLPHADQEHRGLPWRPWLTEIRSSKARYGG